MESGSQSKFPSSKRSNIKFVSLCPGTILSDFRKSAVDGPPEESGARDAAWDAKGKKSDALTPEECAQRAVDAVDRFQKGNILFPAKYKYARFGQLVLPGLVEGIAHKKYEY